MRLLHTTKLTFEEFFESELPPYAILSHRWISRQEISYDEFIDPRNRANSEKSGYKKIYWFADLAREKGLEWCWVDTCCIDKRSSAELSEAINSMYKWYEKAAICIAYLFDVDVKTPLKQSEWFLRGWTLQELLAPWQMEFYNKEFESIGTKKSLLSRLQNITGIRKFYLAKIYDILDASIAERMSWAAQRSTTRTEDVAYCLLGIFDVNMPLLYGEGGEKAFVRLQEAIIERSDDESIFAWTRWSYELGDDSDCTGMLAESPKDFRHSANIRVSKDFSRLGGRNPRLQFHRPPYYQTNHGLEIQVQPQMIQMVHHDGLDEHFAVVPLNCCMRETESAIGDEKAIFVLICRFLDGWVRFACPAHIRGSLRVYDESSEKAFETFRISRPRHPPAIGFKVDESKFIELDSMARPLTLSRLLGVDAEPPDPEGVKHTTK